jgi:hypothetical protein
MDEVLVNLQERVGPDYLHMIRESDASPPFGISFFAMLNSPVCSFTRANVILTIDRAVRSQAIEMVSFF